MKCESCGSPLSLEQKFCPNCGNANTQAMQHAQDMEKYQEEFEYTKSHVYHKTKSFASNSVKAIVSCVLFVIIIVLIYLAVAHYDFAYTWERFVNKMQRQENLEQIEEMLEDGDYYGIGAFCSVKGIYAYDEGYEEYRPIIDMAMQYNWFYNYMLQCVLPNKYWQDGENEWIYGSVASALEQFYRAYATDYEDSYRVGNLDMDKMQPYMDDMVDEVGLILTEYCNLSQEEAMALPYMRDAQRALLIEERMSDAE